MHPPGRTEDIRKKTMTTTIYSVVPTQGMYGSGEIVRSISRHRTLAAAQRAAARYTRDYQRAMSAHGGSSGGYRIVEAWDAGLGHILDRQPDAR
jgi:hypothetical protein